MSAQDPSQLLEASKRYAQWKKAQEEALAKKLERRKQRRAKQRMQARARYAANPEKYRAEKRASVARDPEKVRQRQRVQHWKHRQKRVQKQRANYQEHPEKWVDWRAANLPTVRLIASRRRARKKSLPDTFTLEERAFMLDYWHHACAVCGNQDGFFWTLADDHWVPLASPDCPGTVADNMIPLCDGNGGCNTSKNRKAARDWLLSRVSPAKAKRILRAVETYFAVVRARKAQSAAD